MEYKAIQAMMRPASTIEGMIRFYNHLEIDKTQLKYLVDEFNRLNPEARPPRPYQQVQMPVLLEYCK